MSLTRDANSDALTPLVLKTDTVFAVCLWNVSPVCINTHSSHSLHVNNIIQRTSNAEEKVKIFHDDESRQSAIFTHADYVGWHGDFRVSLFVCLQRNSKMNNFKVFKHGVGNELGIS